MGKVGRPAKPQALKLLQGTARPDRQVENPVDTSGVISADPPPAPSWLTKKEKEFFNDQALVLHKAGILTSLDVQDLAIWASLMRQYVDLHKKCMDGRYVETYINKFKNEKTKKTTVQVSQLTKERERLLSEIQKYSNRFGMNPGDRGQLNVVVPGKKSPTEGTKGKTW